MTNKEYKEKLLQFNSTEKYKDEMKQFVDFMDIDQFDYVLDYGCGTGHMMEYIRGNISQKIFGYDIHKNFYDLDPQFHFTESLPITRFQHIYFMHSFAHIPNIKEILSICKDTLGYNGILSILTPNRLWLSDNTKESYVPDPTVFKHYSASELVKLLYDAGFERIGINFIRDKERIMIKAS